MSYQVLARKWRPQGFAKVVGQDHIVQALKHALERNRLHHAYLFTGTRGVGKTTLARILSKCFNCEKGITPNPCGQCVACQELEQGRFVDLIEVDAASKTKVEDTRELLENVQYSPVRGRFKIYLIDEVHMLSAHSFNALLKTLEEPPEHVKFILATTDPQKVPITILSRCLQFSLRQLLPHLIAEHLKQVLTAERVDFDQEALLALGQAAQGSVRDALSLTDQAIAYGGGRLLADEVHAMLGTVHQQVLLSLLEQLSQQDANALLSLVANWAQEGVDLLQLAKELISALHRLALAKSVPSMLERSVDSPQSWLSLAARFSEAQLQAYYQIALLGYRDLNLVPNLREGFEMMLLRMLLFELSVGPDPLAESAGVRSQQQIAEPQPLLLEQSKPVQVSDAQMSLKDQPEQQQLGQTNQSWQSLLQSLSVDASVRNLGYNCWLARRTDDLLELHLAPSLKALKTQAALTKLTEALQSVFGVNCQVKVLVCEHEQLTPAQLQLNAQSQAQQEAQTEILSDPFLQGLRNNLGAVIQKDSITPISSSEPEVCDSQ